MNYEENEIRQPDEAIYDTLYATPYANAPATATGRRGRGRGRGRGRAPRAAPRPRAQFQEPPQFHVQEPQFQVPPQFQVQEDDNDFDAAIHASIIELNERSEFERILRESAEQYEQDCMAIADTSSLETANLDRLLPTAKTQCRKLGRFDADYLAALDWIEHGCMDTIAPTLINKLKQVRLPRTEMDIILSI